MLALLPATCVRVAASDRDLCNGIVAIDHFPCARAGASAAYASFRHYRSADQTLATPDTLLCHRHQDHQSAWSTEVTAIMQDWVGPTLSVHQQTMPVADIAVDRAG